MIGQNYWVRLSMLMTSFIFNEETPYDLIKNLNPDIIVKGGDYKKEGVVGHDLCDVQIFRYLNEYSTTKND